MLSRISAILFLCTLCSQGQAPPPPTTKTFKSVDEAHGSLLLLTKSRAFVVPPQPPGTNILSWNYDHDRTNIVFNVKEGTLLSTFPNWPTVQITTQLTAAIQRHTGPGLWLFTVTASNTVTQLESGPATR